MTQKLYIHFGVSVLSWHAALWAVLVCVAGLSACETQQQRISEHEDRLSAAGFVIKPANTPERQEMLKKLPADRFVRREHGDAVHFVYADPVVCGCLYIGTQEAYNRFKANELAQRFLDEQRMTADTYSDATWNWGAWGPWGPGFRYVPYGW